MGSGHTHRNKRGGRQNRGGGQRAQGASASTSTNLSASGQARPVATPAPAPAPGNPMPAPTPHRPPASDAAPPSQSGSSGERSRGEPSLRAPYAPGQRAPRGPRQPTPPVESQIAEIEKAAPSHQEFVVTTHHVEPHEDLEDVAEPSAAERDEAFAPPAHADHLPPTQRHNGHTHDAGRRNGHSRERERDHERLYAPARQRFDGEREGNHTDMEAESLAGEDRESPGAAPRGDVRGDVGPLIDDLKALFQRDRAAASANGGTRCGICYLHFALDELEYRDDEGYYVCANCARALGTAHVPMVRRQKRA